MPGPQFGGQGALGGLAAQNEIQQIVAEKHAAATALRDYLDKRSDVSFDQKYKVYDLIQRGDIAAATNEVARMNAESNRMRALAPQAPTIREVEVNKVIPGTPATAANRGWWGIGATAAKPATPERTEVEKQYLNPMTGKVYSRIPLGPKPESAVAGPSMQSETVLVNGTPTLAAFDPKAAKYRSVETGQILTGAQPVPPRDPVMVIQTMDPQGRPIIQGVPQSQLRGQTFGAQPSAAQQTQMSDLESGLGLVKELRDQYDASYVGPVEGRLRPAGQAVGLTGPPGQAKFYGTHAALQNEMIRLITGAAVSVQEQARIMKEIPQITDPDTVFMEKLDQTEHNRARLLEAVRNRAGIGPSAAPPAAGSGGTGRTATPAAPPPGTLPMRSTRAAQPYTGETRQLPNGTWLGKNQTGRVVELTRLPDGTFTIK